MSKEDNWLRGAGPSRMKRLKGVQQRFTQRKLRLFVCACSRSLWGVLVDERSRRAVEVAEEYADGRATREQLKAAEEAASKAEEKAARLAEKTHDDYPHSAATAAWLGTSEAIKQPPYAVARREMQCDLLRDVIGNPHRPLPALEPRWLPRTCGPGPRRWSSRSAFVQPASSSASASSASRARPSVPAGRARSS